MDHHGGHAHHGHGHAAGATRPEPSDGVRAARGVVVPHGELQAFENNGNELVGVATPSLGAQEHEVWRSRVAVGSKTPLHTHESEEIFVFLKGQGKALIGDRELEFRAPATVIAPAGVAHQFINTGSEPTEALVIVRIGSRIVDAQGEPLDLPWRR